MANSVDPDQTILQEQSDLSLRSLPRPVRLNIKEYCGAY